MDIPRAIVEIFQQIKERLQITVVCSIEDMVAFISWMALCAKINEGHSETSFSLEAKPQRSHCVLLVNNGVRFRRGSRDETRRPGTLLFFSSFLLLFLLFGHFLHLFRSFFLFLFYGIPNDAVAFASVRSPPTAPQLPIFSLVSLHPLFNFTVFEYFYASFLLVHIRFFLGFSYCNHIFFLFDRFFFLSFFSPLLLYFQFFITPYSSFVFFICFCIFFLKFIIVLFIFSFCLVFFAF